MANAKIISLIDHAVATTREASIRDLETVFAFVHGELNSLGAKLGELRYDVDQLMSERHRREDAGNG